MIQSNRRNEVWKKINYMVLQQRVPVAPQQWWFGRVWNSRALKPGIMSSLSLLGLEGYEITWFSNTDVAGVAQSSALEKSKLHGTQTLRCARAIGRKVWKKVKLHGTQTSRISSENGTKLWKKSKIAWFSNISCMANKISPLWRRVKSYGSQINRAQYFCVHFCLKGTKKS